VPHEGGVLVSAPSLRYTVTMPPDDMDSTAIAIGERVRIDDKVSRWHCLSFTLPPGVARPNPVADMLRWVSNSLRGRPVPYVHVHTK